MLKTFFTLCLIALGLTLAHPSFALGKPDAPTPPPVLATAPLAPSAPDIPAPPDVSGVYDVPERPGMKVRVFAHPEKPTTPQKPGTSPSPSATSSNSLVCNLEDPSSSSVTGSAGWHLPSGTITYRLNTSSVPSSVGGSNLYTIVKSGFDKYSAETNGKVAFTKDPTNTSTSRSRYDGQNIIAWNRLSSGTLGITYVWYYTLSKEVAEVDTIMNSRYKWTWSNGNACVESTTYDAQNIMTHELGHWLGLDDEYDGGYINNTMFGYGSKGEVKKNTLTAGDIAGVGAIYP